MNTVAMTGTVLGTPDKVQQRSCGYVCNFRVVIDTRSAKRPTEITVSCWDDLARFCGQYLVAGDRIAVIGAVSHMVGEGVVIAASQIARLGDEPIPNAASPGLDDSEIEKNWTNYIGLPGARK